MGPGKSGHQDTQYVMDVFKLDSTVFFRIVWWLELELEPELKPEPDTEQEPEVGP